MMKLIALGNDEVINLESIASAMLDDSSTRGGTACKLTITFASGQNTTFSNDNARKLWTAIKDAAN
jgi:hypothetical protein